MEHAPYPLIVEPLTDEEGGGSLASVLDLPGCMSGGETPAAAVRNVQDAISAWIEAAHQMGRVVPAPRAKLAVA